MPPTILLESLHAIRRRVKLLSILFGLGLALAAAIGLLLVIVLLDYALNLPAIPRLLVIVLSLSAVAVVLYRLVVRPALARTTINDIAGRLESAFPQFDDRLRSTVDFLRADLPGSQVMKEKVVFEATQLAKSTDLTGAIVTRPVWYSLSMAVGSVVLLLALSMLAGSNFRSIAFSRLFTPFHAQPWPKSVEISLLDDVPALIPVGQPLNIRMKLVRGDTPWRKAIIHYRSGDGAEQQEYMVRGDDGVYAASLDARAPSAPVAASAASSASGASHGLLKVWIESGDDENYLNDIKVVPRLAITRVQATITPPAYSKLPATTTDLSAGPAITAIGAQISLQVEFNKSLLPGSAVTLEPLNAQAKVPAATWQIADSSRALGTWTADQSLRFHLRATDSDRFQNVGLEEYEIIVKPDMSPTVQIEFPRGNEQRLPGGYVALQAVAEDDYGIKTASLMVDRVGDNKKTDDLKDNKDIKDVKDRTEKKQHWEIPLLKDGQPLEAVSWTAVSATPDRQRNRLNYQWEPSQLPGADLKPGDVLEYYIQVQDNFELPGEPAAGTIASPDKPGSVIHPPVPSGHLRLSIISQQDLERILTDALITTRTQVQLVKNDQERTHVGTQDLNKNTKEKPVLDPADQADLERLTNQQTTAASQAKQIGGKMDALLQKMEENRFKQDNGDELKQIARDVQTDLNQAAESPMKDATGHLNQAKQNKGDPKASDDQQKKTTEQRTQALANAGNAQQQANEQLDKALARLANMGSLSEIAREVQHRFEEQKDATANTEKVGRSLLGLEPKTMKPEDRDKLDAVVKEQQKVAAQTAKTLSAMDKMAQQLAKTDPQASQAMKQAGEIAKQQQVNQKQNQAAQDARQNQQASAQAAQKQAELGLQMILKELRDAERRKLEELAKQLAKLQEQVANLIRRQAGHNHDNLRLQGPDAVTKAGQKTIDELIEKSNRRAMEPPIPDLGQLSQAQALTEQNTRDIAKSAEQLPSGAEIAANLNRAADEMGRAIAYLRSRKLPDAYEPPQVQALLALQDAKKIIDAQQEQIAQQQQDQQRDAIRQAYEKVRDAQVKLNEKVVAVDQLPRTPDGQPRWEDRDRFTGLPGEQGTLAEQIQKIGKDVEALDSIIYTWANKNVERSMNGVKAELAKPATGADTQQQQKRIVASLDDMIKNLVETQRKSPFAQRQQGGSGRGGGSKPKLTEAELRLLKAMQLGVNTDTKEADAAPQKDKARILQIGTRQGEMRDLLDKLLQQSKSTLGPEPDNRDQLPEEAKDDDIEAQELQNLLLTGKPGDQQSDAAINLVGDRMARSRQRLALNSDPGKVTQKIQDRIIIDIEKLIEQAQKQVADAKPKPGEAQQQQPPKPGGKAENEGKESKPNRNSSPAKASNLSGGGDPHADLSQELKETMTEWGGTTPRLRDAVMQGATDAPIQKYYKFVQDYYRSLATKATESRPGQ